MKIALGADHRGYPAKARIKAVLEEMGIEARALPVDADLLSIYATEGVQAVVDIGHERTLVGLSNAGKMVAARAISSGGRDLTEALMQTGQMSWLEAEDLKHGLQSWKFTRRPVLERKAKSRRRALFEARLISNHNHRTLSLGDGFFATECTHPQLIPARIRDRKVAVDWYAI